MSWIVVEIEGIDGMARGNEVTCPNAIGEDPTSVTVNGASYAVEDWRVDERDDVIYLTLADADFKNVQTAQEEDDDEPTEGGDPDNSGE